MKRWALYLVGVAVLLLVFIYVARLPRLGEQPEEKVADVATMMAGAAGRMAPGGTEGAMPASAELTFKGEGAAPQNPTEPDRYLILNADVQLEVADARKARDELLALTRQHGGYVLSMTDQVDPLGARTTTIAVRIRSTAFSGVLTAIERLGKPLYSQSNAEDVTEEYVDGQSRLRNLTRTEERLLAHLGRSAKMADTLAVERELSRVRQEIERLQGRLKFLKHRVDYSTITVTLREAARQRPFVNPEAFSSAKVLSDAVRSLVDFARAVWSLLIWIGIWSVVWLPLLILAWYVARRKVGMHRPPPAE